VFAEVSASPINLFTVGNRKCVALFSYRIPQGTGIGICEWASAIWAHIYVSPASNSLCNEGLSNWLVSSKNSARYGNQIQCGPDNTHAHLLAAAAIMLMIQNNLDPAVALYPHELITYGGNGAVFQNWLVLVVSMSTLILWQGTISSGNAIFVPNDRRADLSNLFWSSLGVCHTSLHPISKSCICQPFPKFQRSP